MEEINPHNSLGIFKLGDSINKILTIIKQRGDLYNHCDIITYDKNPEKEFYIYINKEGIKLRFNGFTQKLEIIEKNFNENNENELEYSYKNQLIFSSKNKSNICYSLPDYQYITSIFGLSKVPKFLNNFIDIFLPYDGISFLFKNINYKNEEIDLSSQLNKLFIFKEDNILDSVKKEKEKFNKYKTFTFNLENKEKGVFYEKNINLKIGDNIEKILNFMKNPNYVYKKKINEDDDLYLSYYNYFEYGIDLVVDNNGNFLKKIIFHTNYFYDNKFGIYEKCNFLIEIPENYFKKYLNEKILKKVNKNIKENNNDYSINKNLLEIQNNFFSIENKKIIENQITNNNLKLSELEIKNTFVQKNNNNHNHKNELNYFKGKLKNLKINPHSNFLEILENIPPNSYLLYQKHDKITNKIYKYYSFDDIIFEILDDQIITSIVIY